MINWQDYETLLQDLALQSSSWQSSKTCSDFRSAITLSYPVMLGGEGTKYDDCGLTALEEELTAELMNEELVYEQIRLAALASGAESYGGSWVGRVLSTRANGERVWANSPYTAPADWTKVNESELAVTPGKVAEKPALEFDEATKLFFDALNWYLPDGTTIVTQLGDTDVFEDAQHNRYRMGKAFLWYDQSNRLLYDDDYWYLKDGKTIVTEAGGDVYTDEAGTRYRLGEAFLWYDQPTRLLYDDVNWYLKDGTTIVTEAGGDVYTDQAGTRYRLGEPFLWYDQPTRLLYDDVNWYLKDGATIVTQVGETDVYADKTGNRYQLGELMPAIAELPGEPGQEPDEDEGPDEVEGSPELAEALESTMAETLQSAISGIRDLDLSDEDISDDEIADLFAEEVERLLRIELDG